VTTVTTAWTTYSAAIRSSAMDQVGLRRRRPLPPPTASVGHRSLPFLGGNTLAAQEPSVHFPTATSRYSAAPDWDTKGASDSVLDSAY
jgi:hypothetical protein